MKTIVFPGMNMPAKSILHAAAICLLAVASAQSHAQTAASSVQNRLSSLLSGSAEEQLLPPDEAFRFAVTKTESGLVRVQLMPASGYYLYKDKIRFAVRDASGIAIRSTQLPAGEIKADPTFGKTEVYHKPVPVVLTLERSGQARNLTLVASYQGCHEKRGVCYAPIEKTVALVLP